MMSDTKTVYHYNDSGVFDGTREAQYDASAKAYRLPANCTFDAPPLAKTLLSQYRWGEKGWVEEPMPNRAALIASMVTQPMALFGAPAAYSVTADELVDVKKDVLVYISAATKAVRNQVAGTADDAEIAGWTNKLRIAQAITAGSASDFDRKSFEQEIKLRAIEGETLDVFVGKVLRNAGFYGQAVALIDGAKRSAEDAVKAAKSVAEINKAIATLQARLNAGMAELLKAAA
jgi:hypothetical protein